MTYPAYEYPEGYRPPVLVNPPPSPPHKSKLGNVHIALATDILDDAEKRLQGESK